MKTINLTHPLIIALHSAIMTEYNCCLGDIIGVKDTPAKTMAVFFVRHFYQVPLREIADVYTINRLYIETVVDRHKEYYAYNPAFVALVHRVLDFVELHCDETAA